MKAITKILAFAFLSILSANSFAQLVTLQGKQFKLNGNNFYPVVMNYNISRTTSDVLGNTIFYATPSGSYGSTGNYECNNENTCNTDFQNQFAKVAAMGFNTVRIDASVTYRSDVPVTATSRHFTVFYDENLGANQWQTKNRAYDLDMASNFTDQNSTNHFGIITNLLNQAQTAGLKVILICGGSFKDTLPPKNRIMWQTYDALAAAHFSTYLTKLSSVVGTHPALLAFDFINEPIYQDMWRDGTGSSVKKETICSYVSQWYDALRTSSNNLITLGSSATDELFYFDTGIMKLDFYSPHIYTKGHPMYPNYSNTADYGIQNGFDRYEIVNYWMGKVYPMPWIIGETGFAADDNTTNPGLFPNHLDNDPIHHNPPWMFGSETQQQAFAQYSLDVTRNAGASGYAWWAFQNVFWFDLTSQAHEYAEDFFGLLHFGDGTTNTWYDKPAVSVFQSYLNAQGQPPAAVPLTQPVHYYDPYEIAVNCATCVPKTVQGKVVDYEVPSNDIENALVLGTSWLSTDDNILLNNPIDDLYLHDISYTFTENDGTFNVMPYNYKQPGIVDPHRLVSIEISAVAGERLRLGPDWPYGELQMANPGTVTLKKIVNGYDALASNEIVAVDEVRNYYGRNTLVASNLELNGESNLTARQEININTEFHAHASITANNNNEIHIYISDAFPDCSPDFAGYLRTTPNTSPTNETVNSSSKEIEVKFNVAKNLLVDVSPNPSTGIFNVTIQNPLSNNIQVLVTNLLGEIILKTIKTQAAFSFNFDLLPKGIYYMQFNNNEQWLTKKIIIN